MNAKEGINYLCDAAGCGIIVVLKRRHHGKEE